MVGVLVEGVDALQHRRAMALRSPAIGGLPAKHRKTVGQWSKQRQQWEWGFTGVRRGQTACRGAWGQSRCAPADSATPTERYPLDITSTCGSRPHGCHLHEHLIERMARFCVLCKTLKIFRHLAVFCASCPSMFQKLHISSTGSILFSIVCFC